MSPNNDETHSHSHLHSRSLWHVRASVCACVCMIYGGLTTWIKWTIMRSGKKKQRVGVRLTFASRGPFQRRGLFSHSRAPIISYKTTHYFCQNQHDCLQKKPDSNRFAVYSGCSSFSIANLIENQYLGSFSWGEKNTVQISSKFLIYDVFC